MAFQVEIVTIRQEYSLEQGLTANFLVLRLPSGRIVQALVEDNVVSEVVALAAQQGHEARPVIPDQPEESSAAPVAQLDDGTLVAVFGGTEPQAPSDPQEEPPPQIPRPPMRSRVRAPKVEADSAGNPIAAVRNGVDAGTVLGGESDPGEALSI